MNQHLLALAFDTKTLIATDPPPLHKNITLQTPKLYHNSKFTILGLNIQTYFILIRVEFEQFRFCDLNSSSYVT